jgi:hypothetical protein
METSGNWLDTYGWCENPEHGGTDHRNRKSCVRFVSDRDFTAQLLQEARIHDREAIRQGMPEDGGASARYVAEHRPY